MYKNHIERLKRKIREMEVTSMESEARLKASEDRLEHQQRTIDSNAVLLQTLQTQHTNAQAEKVSMNVALQNNSVMLQTVQGNMQLYRLAM
jgi:hypothetical protein